MSNNKKLQVKENIRPELEKRIDNTAYYIFLLMIVAMPFIIRAKQINFISPIITHYNYDTAAMVDIFSYYRFVFIVIMTVALYCLLFIKIANGYRVKNGVVPLVLALMAILVTLSTWFSEFKSIALFGMFNSHEGTITYLCYLSIMFVALNTKFDHCKLKLILYALIPLLLINVFFGILSLLKYNILVESKFFRSLIYSSNFGLNLERNPYFTNTLANLNHVSGIAAVLASIYITRAILIEENREKAVNILLSAFSFVLLLTSLSASGFVSLIVAMPLISFFTIKHSKKISIKSLGVVVAVLLLIFGMIYATHGNIWKETVGYLVDIPNLINQIISYNIDSGNIGPGSGRLYIWLNSFDLIKEKPILGYGLDTLTYYFPQNQAAMGYYTNIIISMPHNIYINLMYGSGIISGLLFLILVGYCFYQVVTDIPRNLTILSIDLASLTVGWTTYLVQGLFNDSIIGTGFIFWLFLGLSGSLFLDKSVVR